MATLSLEFGTDFQLNANGGLAMSQGPTETRQAFERAMFACPQLTLNDSSQIDPDLLFSVNFGAGLGMRIGQNPTGQWLSDIKRAALYAAQHTPGVDPTVPPVIALLPGPNARQQVLTVTFASNTGPQTLNYTVSS